MWRATGIGGGSTTGKVPENIVFFKVPEGKIIQTNKVEKGFHRLLLTPDNPFLFGSQDGAYWIWSVKDFGIELIKKQPAHKGTIHAMAMSRDWQTLLTAADGTLIQWSLADPRNPGQLREWQNLVIVPSSHSIDIAPDNRHAAVGRTDGRVLILRLGAK